MEMKTLTAAELKRVLEQHFRRHVQAARVDLDANGAPVLMVQFVANKNNETGHNDFRTART